MALSDLVVLIVYFPIVYGHYITISLYDYITISLYIYMTIWLYNYINPGYNNETQIISQPNSAAADPRPSIIQNKLALDLYH